MELNQYHQEVQPLITDMLIEGVRTNQPAYLILQKVEAKLGSKMFQSAKWLIEMDIEGWQDVQAQGDYAYDQEDRSPWEPSWEQKKQWEEEEQWNMLEDISGEMAQ